MMTGGFSAGAGAVSTNGALIRRASIVEDILPSPSEKTTDGS
jgi:hypothetical protein